MADKKFKKDGGGFQHRNPERNQSLIDSQQQRRQQNTVNSNVSDEYRNNTQQSSNQHHQSKIFITEDIEMLNEHVELRKKKVSNGNLLTVDKEFIATMSSRKMSTSELS